MQVILKQTYLKNIFNKKDIEKNECVYKKKINDFLRKIKFLKLHNESFYETFMEHLSNNVKFNISSIKAKLSKM